MRKGRKNVSINNQFEGVTSFLRRTSFSRGVSEDSRCFCVDPLKRYALSCFVKGGAGGMLQVHLRRDGVTCYRARRILAFKSGVCD